jgi:hypothetical protein
MREKRHDQEDLVGIQKAICDLETVEKPASVRLMENVQMQGFRNSEE